MHKSRVAELGPERAARRASVTPWSDERVVDEIRALDGTRPSSTLRSTALRRFGSWRAARVAAGVEPQTRRWDETSIGEALQKRIDRTLPLDATAVRREDSPLFSAVEHRYGSFDDVVQRFVRSGRFPRRRGSQH